MKRLLAIILSLAMLIGMVPAVFAEGEATAVSSPEYLFVKTAVTGKTDSDSVNIADVTTDVINTAVSTGKWGYISQVSTRTCSLGRTSMDFMVQGTNGVLGTNVTGFEIIVDKSGRFVPSLTFQPQVAAYSSNVHMFLVPSDTHEKPTETAKLGTWMQSLVSEAVSGGATDIKHIFKGVSTVKPEDYTETYKTEQGDEVNLDAGTYYLLISLVDVDATPNNAYAYIRSVKLESQPYVAVSASTTVEKNKTTNVVGGKIYDGEGNELGKPDSYTYTTSDSNIATVDATTGLVTGIAAGTARITVTAEYNGTEYTGSVDITVTDPDIFDYTAVYNFTNAAVKSDSWINMSEVTESYTLDSVVSSGKWWYVGNHNASYSITGSNSWTTYVSKSSGVLGNNMLILKIRLAHDGEYIPQLTHRIHASSQTKLHVFIVPESEYNTASPADSVNAAIAGQETDVIYAFRGVDNYITEYTANTNVPVTGTSVPLKAGDYYLFVSLEGYGDVVTSNRYYSSVVSLSLERTGPLPEGEEPGDEPEDTVQTAPETVAYATNIDGVISVMGTGITRGTEVTVTALEVTGKVFRHWVLGTATNGTWVSDLPTYTFPLMTNTYLTAVYAPAPAEGEKIVEFFNYNGEYLTQKTVDAEGKVELPENTSLTGYVFSRWLLAKDTPVTEATVFTNAITRVVAELTATGSYTVNGEDCTYDDKISDSANEEVEWYRDGVLVGYGTTYDYFVWDNVTAITNAPISGAKTPVVVLDDAVKAGKACMIEYDAAGKTIKEVGILFGATDEIDVDSCDSKATSQRKNTHGQFTAKPRTDGNASYARGYIIYEDSGLKVKYTDAISLPNN